MNRLTDPGKLEAFREEVRSSLDPAKLCVTVCGGTGCRACGSLRVADALAEGIKKSNLDAEVRIRLSGCHGFCQQGPVVAIDPEGIFYRKVGLDNLEEDVQDIVNQTLAKGEVVERLLYEDPHSGEKVTHYGDIVFYAKQQRIALRNSGKIDPTDLSEYIAAGGYGGLAQALSMDPEAVITCVKKSGLRGRGGAGFPTGTKWSFCRGAEDLSLRYIVCNADEGDPGAFMDRSIMEADPHSVLEGMIIGAWAMAGGISSAEGYIYIRAEYPLAVANLRKAIADAEAAGLLGDDILGSGFGFHVKVKEGAGAFVCGEETALLASIEGRRGMPRSRPPFPANAGLYGKPSNINNVETWANVPVIITRGPDWYSGIGTDTSAGTKVFSLVGKIRNSGLVEVPMGIPMREIVFDIGGGIPDDKAFKAVQTGGPSGGCIPADMLDIEVDYDKLTAAGSIMGSGGLVVVDEDTCMVELARYFLSFAVSESCGKCAPCRLGTKQMVKLLTDITSGRGKPEDIELLQEVAEAVRKGSLCGLGQTAPNPVLTTIKYFRNEYEEHVNQGKCSAGVCQALLKYEINEETCIGCTLCAKACPADSIEGEKKKPHRIDQVKCVRCGACFEACRVGAVVRV